LHLVLLQVVEVVLASWMLNQVTTPGKAMPIAHW